MHDRSGWPIGVFVKVYFPLMNQVGYRRPPPTGLTGVLPRPSPTGRVGECQSKTPPIDLVLARLWERLCRRYGLLLLPIDRGVRWINGASKVRTPPAKGISFNGLRPYRGYMASTNLVVDERRARTAGPTVGQ